MKRNRFAIGCAAMAALAAAAAGCGKSDSTPATKQEVASFKGHQPTAEQLKEAMSKASSHSTGAPNASAPK